MVVYWFDGRINNKREKNAIIKNDSILDFLIRTPSGAGRNRETTGAYLWLIKIQNDRKHSCSGLLTGI